MPRSQPAPTLARCHDDARSEMMIVAVTGAHIVMYAEWTKGLRGE